MFEADVDVVGLKNGHPVLTDGFGNVVLLWVFGAFGGFGGAVGREVVHGEQMLLLFVLWQRLLQPGFLCFVDILRMWAVEHDATVAPMVHMKLLLPSGRSKKV